MSRIVNCSYLQMHKKPSRKSHARRFSQTIVGLGYLVAVTRSRPIYLLGNFGVYMLLQDVMQQPSSTHYIDPVTAT